MNHLHGDDLPYRANARAGLNIPVFQFGQAIPVKNTLLGNRQANQTNEALLAQTGTNAAIYITLYPEEGLAAVTDDEIDKLVAQLKGYDDKGISVWLRFAPEMNGMCIQRASPYCAANLTVVCCRQLDDILSNTNLIPCHLDPHRPSP